MSCDYINRQRTQFATRGKVTYTDTIAAYMQWSFIMRNIVVPQTFCIIIFSQRLYIRQKVFYDLSNLCLQGLFIWYTLRVDCDGSKLCRFLCFRCIYCYI